MTLLRINLLGKPIVSLDGKPVFEDNFTRVQALLYFLATTRRTHYRSEVATLFWPEVPDTQALKNLRNILPTLRTCLDEHIVVTRQTVAFDSSLPYWLDVEAFESLLGTDPAQASTDTLLEAVNLYTDDFLNGFYIRNAPLFEEWMLLKREQLRGLFINTLQTLASRHLQQRDYQATLHATRRLLTVAPWHERGHQQQMQALLGLGERSAALDQYHACCRILATEFNAPPDSETTYLYEQIKSLSFSSPAEAFVGDPIPDNKAIRIDAPLHRASLRAATYRAENRSGAEHVPVAMSFDGTFLAVPDTQETLRLENLLTSKCLHWRSGHSDTVSALSFSPDGRMLASASADQTIRLWDTASGALRATLSGHGDAVTAVSFSPDGHILASASADQTVRLWVTTTGSLYSTLQGHKYPVVHVVFVPDGTRLVSTDTSRVVLFWYLATRHRIDLQAHIVNL